MSFEYARKVAKEQETINELDPQYSSYDFVWKLSTYKTQFEIFHSS